MPDLDPRFASMTAAAQGLQIAQDKAQIGTIPHRLDVIDLEPVACALDALPAVAPLGLEPQSRPPTIPVNRPPVPIIAAAHVRTCNV